MGSDVLLPDVVDDVEDGREYRCDVRFKFTGRINKVIFNLGEEKFTAEEQEMVHQALARARDEPQHRIRAITVSKAEHCNDMDLH